MSRIKCIVCDGETKVTDTRDTIDSITRRRLECKDCEKRFNSFEMDENQYHKVLKFKSVFNDLQSMLETVNEL